VIDAQGADAMRSTDVLAGAVDGLRRRCGEPVPDGELLARFAGSRDEAAFAELVRRHGGLVLGVARRQLGDRQRAEDVFQSTFLALARQAPRLGRSESLVNWLYTVALRQAQKTRQALVRRDVRFDRFLPPSAPPDPLAEVSGRELVAVIDAELTKLPAAYRLPLLLCAIEGLSCEEAARRLGWSAGSVKGRLRRGRELLRARLEARGLTVPAVLTGILITDTATAVPPALVTATSRAALAVLAVPAAGLSLKAVWFSAALLLASVSGVALVASSGREPERPEDKVPVAQAPGSPEPAPHVDREGVPLPPRALARMGSTRMRHAGRVHAVNFAQSGRMLVSLASDGVLVSDVATGRPFRRFQVPIDGAPELRICDLHTSPDGRELLVVHVDYSVKDPPARVHRFDLPSGRQVSVVNLAGEGPIKSTAVSHTGKWIAVGRIGQPSHVCIHEAATGRETSRIPITAFGPRYIDFAPDERTLALADIGDTISFYDLTTGRPTSILKGEGERFIFVNYSPDGQTLATISSPLDVPPRHRVELWDVARRTRRVRLPLPELEGLTHQVSFSADSRFVATCSQGMEVILWDAVTGKENRRLLSYQTVTKTAFSPDGRTLAAAHSSGTVLLWDVDSGRLLPASAEPMVGVWRLEFRDKGRRLVGTTGRPIAWDSTTGREAEQFAMQATGWGWQVLSPDGKTTAALTKDWLIQLADAKTGQEMRVLRGEKRLTWAGSLRFTADGQRLIAVGEDHVLHVFDVTSGRTLHTHSTGNGWGDPLAVSRDGRWLAEADRYARPGKDENPIRLWDLTSFQQVNWFAPPSGPVQALEFSPDGRRLAWVSCANARTERSSTQLCDVPSARSLWAVEGGPAMGYCLAFSPDGRTLATGGEGNAIRLLEAVTGGERHRIVGHAGEIQSIAFAPDGRTLAASSPEAPVYIWDAFGLAELPRQPLTAAELDETWSALAGPDAKAAFRAMRRLIAAPEPAVAFLRERLKPVPAVEPRRVQALIGQLDSERFADRQRAVTELEKLAEQAVADLRAAATVSKSAEVRATLQRLLDRLDTSTPESLRAIRAIEVLEQTGTPVAREHLKALAGGASGAELTRAAADALKRLSRNSANNSPP
jgi:RNA polymerase sigma factor (sigma-70 family)